MPAFDFISLTYFDYIVLVIIGLSAVFSMLRGMTREFLGLAGWFWRFYSGDHRPFHERLDLQLFKGGRADEYPFLGAAFCRNGRDLVYPCLAYLARLKRAGLGALIPGLVFCSGFCAGCYFP